MKLTEPQRAFIVDTLKHYNSTNRGLMPVTNVCCYAGGCAVGRHLDQDLCVELDCGLNKAVDSNVVFNRLPEWMQELGKEFLGLCQSLHDCALIWEPTGINWDAHYRGFGDLRSYLKSTLEGEDLYPLVMGN